MGPEFRRYVGIGIHVIGSADALYLVFGCSCDYDCVDWILTTS